MLTGPTIILTLKVLVTAVTILLVASLAALAAGNPRLHGRLNAIFFALTMLTVAGFEAVLQFVDVASAFDPAAREALRVHLYFAVPSAIVLPLMYLSGWSGRKRLHRALAVLFATLWVGTFVTGVFFLPHA